MKTFILILMGFLLIGAGAQAQEKDARDVDRSQYYEELETPPELIGGIAELAKHVKYPPSAAKEGVEGTVVLSAYIGTSGSVDAVEVETSPNDELSQAAVDAVEQVSFKPGTVDGKAVKSIVKVPVKFRLK